MFYAADLTIDQPNDNELLHHAIKCSLSPSMRGPPLKRHMENVMSLFEVCLCVRADMLRPDGQPSLMERLLGVSVVDHVHVHEMTRNSFNLSFHSATSIDRGDVFGDCVDNFFVEHHIYRRNGWNWKVNVSSDGSVDSDDESASSGGEIVVID